jgi:hypothetical protein
MHATNGIPLGWTLPLTKLTLVNSVQTLKDTSPVQLLAFTPQRTLAPKSKPVHHSPPTWRTVHFLHMMLQSRMLSNATIVGLKLACFK